MKIGNTPVEENSDRPRRIVLSDDIYQRIRDRLLRHEIEPGARINIDALARDLQVSQTPVREGLARLESEGLVTKEPLRGYAATELLTLAEMQDLFQFRGLIEPWAARSAARHIDDEGSTRLRQELERGKKAEGAKIEDAYKLMSEHDARFHTLIAELSGSDFVHDAYVGTHCHLHLFRLYTVLKSWMNESSKGDADVVRELFELYYEPKSGFLAFKEHTAIAEAIIGGNGATAEKLMREHIENSMSRFTPTMSAIEAGR